MKIFFHQNVVRADIFNGLFGGFEKSIRCRRIFCPLILRRSRKMRSDYFQNTPHFRKTQIIAPVAACGGDQIVRFCPHKTELAVVR